MHFERPMPAEAYIPADAHDREAVFTRCNADSSRRRVRSSMGNDMEAVTVQIAKLELQPGDTLAVLAPGHISKEQAAHIKQLMSDALPDGVKCIVLSGLALQRIPAIAAERDTNTAVESIVRRF